jgi:hypothetical protein
LRIRMGEERKHDCESQATRATNNTHVTLSLSQVTNH